MKLKPSDVCKCGDRASEHNMFGRCLRCIWPECKKFKRRTKPRRDTL